MGSTKPITKDLVAVMDRTKIQNRLGADVTEKADLLRHRTTYLGVMPAECLRKGAVAITVTLHRRRSS
jgi:hypothetical protein